MPAGNKAFEERAKRLTYEMLRVRDSIVCIDSHTGGEPTRLVVGGLPEIKGDNITKKSEFFAENYDYLRTTLTAEPRGRKAMHAFVICPPSTEEADFGVIIMCALGYLGMCGHGLIGTVASVIEAGIVGAVEPITHVAVETPSGLMKVRADISSGKVEGVTFRNQPSFVYKEDLEVEVDKFGKLKVDVAYGGNWYVVADVEQIGLGISIENLEQFAEANALILEAVNANISAEHPQLGPAGEIPQMVFMGPAKNPEADGTNLVTSEALGYDRLAGEADLITEVTPKDRRTLEATRQAAVVALESSVCTVFMCNVGSGVCADRRVRQALNYALDVPAIIETVMDGAARPINGPLTPTHFGYDPLTPPYPYDPDKARALLAEAGYADGLRLVLDIPTVLPDEAPRLAQCMAEQYVLVGITAEINEFTNRPGYADMVRAKQIDDACCFDSSPLSTYRVMREKFHSGVRGPWWQGYTNPQVDALLDQARATADNAQRRDLYRRAYRLIRDDAPWILLYNSIFFWGVGPRACGWTVGIDGLVRLV